MAFSLDYTRIKSDGLASWKVKRSGDTGHYSLGNLEDGKIDSELITEDDSVLRNLPVALKFMATSKSVSTDETTMIKTMDSFASGAFNSIITAANGATFQGDFGFIAKLVSDADLDKNMYMEFTADGNVLPSGTTYPSWQTILATPSPGTPVSGDTLYALNSLPTTRNAAGIRKAEMQVHSGGGYADMGAVRKGKFTAETLVQKDGFQMSRAYGLIVITVEFDQMQTSTEFADLSTFLNIDLRITFACGYVCTIGNNVGLSWQPKLMTNTKDIAYTHWKLTGSIQASAWDALWS